MPWFYSRLGEHVFPAPHGAEKLTVFTPRPNQLISGGKVTIEGAGWGESDLPLVAEGLDRQGGSLGRSEFHLTSDEPGELGTFRVEVSFPIDRYQPGKVVVSELGAGIPGLVHLNAVDVMLRALIPRGPACPGAPGSGWRRTLRL